MFDVNNTIGNHFLECMESSSYESAGLVHVMLLKLSSHSLFLWQILPAWMSMNCLYFADKKIKGCGNCCPLTCRWDLGRVSFVSTGHMWDLQVCFAACSTIHLWAACSWQHEVNGFPHWLRNIFYTSPLSVVLNDWLYGHLTCLFPRAISFWSMGPIIKAAAVLDRAIT